MFILLTYDVNVVSENGAKRLRKVAKVCESYGVRVQNSVFELCVDSAQLVMIKRRLSQTIDEKSDSIRLYILGKKGADKIEVLGKDVAINQEGTLIL
ncbi:MAG: CRISPR-associated endonuclease Cas2 [Clostridiaceae bacterium]|nr:CRISPR-associated endonuclease Cas2 [Clostridiaceae bacterium]